ncbi:MAG: hypothetical protein MJZ26_06305 [Fibrobacter sp.]|nr:hypothetical protein [Fibrobacter sp.]
MKKSLLLVVPFVLLFLNACATDADEGFDASSVCPAEGTNGYGMPNRGTFVDERDGQVYKYTTIGDQVWMAENLNHVADYSACYDNDELNCDFWGRFYSLLENGKNEAPMNYAMVDSICPTGWHVPSSDEWDKLINLVGKYQDDATAKRLKSTQLWTEEASGGNGSDDCGFSAIPAGGHSGRKIEYMYRYAYFWTSTMFTEDAAYAIIFGDTIGRTNAHPKMSIRCIKD